MSTLTSTTTLEFTELVLAIELKRKVDHKTIKALEYMLGEADYLIHIPDHSLFNTSGWEHMLQTDSYYFPGEQYSKLKYDKITESYHLVIRCNFQDSEWETREFLDWIKPEVYTEGFVGYFRNTKQEKPVLIFFQKDKIELLDCVAVSDTYKIGWASK